VTFTGLNNTVDSGNTNTFIVTVEWIIVDSAANNQGWTVRLNDLTIQPGSTGTGTYNISTYQNLGDLPITEVR
jgi:hypothetical protein